MTLGKKLFMLGIGLYASMAVARADACDYYTAKQMEGKTVIAPEVVEIGHGYESTYGPLTFLCGSNAITNGNYVKNPPKNTKLTVINGVGFNFDDILARRFRAEEVGGKKIYRILPIPVYILREADSNGDKMINPTEAESDFNRRLEDIN